MGEQIGEDAKTFLFFFIFFNEYMIRAPSSHLGVVTVVGVTRAAGVKVTHVLLQGPDVLRETDNRTMKGMSAGERGHSAAPSLPSARELADSCMWT